MQGVRAAWQRRATIALAACAACRVRVVLLRLLRWICPVCRLAYVCLGASAFQQQLPRKRGGYQEASNRRLTAIG
jgi:hypothetical protein